MTTPFLFYGIQMVDTKLWGCSEIKKGAIINMRLGRKRW